MEYIKSVVPGVLGSINDIDFKKLLIFATICAFVIACVITVRQTYKKYFSEDAGKNTPIDMSVKRKKKKKKRS